VDRQSSIQSDSGGADVPRPARLNVTDLEEAIGFYSKLFATEPAKVRPGYANFAVAEPPLKLVLIEGDTGGTLNHLGVEVASTDEVAATGARLRGEGVATATEDQVSCCFAVQDKVWVDGPDGEPWEVYTVLADAEHPQGELRGAEPAGSCRGSVSPEVAARLNCC